MAKLLFLVTEDWFLVSHFLPMAQTARDSGFQVAVATRVSGYGEYLASEGIRVIPVESKRGSFRLSVTVRDFFQYFRIVRAERPDVVHCISLRPIVIGGLAAKFAGNASLVLAPTGLGHLWVEHGAGVWFVRKIVQVVIGRLLRGRRTHYLFENPDDPREFGIDPRGRDVTQVGGAGIESSIFSQSPEPSLPPMKVAVVSRMIAPKGIAEAVAAVQRARAADATIELHLFGEPDPANPRSIPLETLRQWAALPGIVWHGRTADIASVWGAHHVAMLLSYREGLPRSLVEAAASGRPILTTDVAGCREVVRDGVEGILVPCGDVGAAAHALLKLASNQDLRVRMGAAAHLRFQQRFTAAAVQETVRGLYLSLRRQAL